MYRLKKNGRTAVILPDGFLLGTDNAKPTEEHGFIVWIYRKDTKTSQRPNRWNSNTLLQLWIGEVTEKKSV